MDVMALAVAYPRLLDVWNVLGNHHNHLRWERLHIIPRSVPVATFSGRTRV